MAKLTTTALIEKIVRAKVRIEMMRRSHADRCIVELDPDSTAPCDCGATTLNREIESILAELSLE